MKTTTTSIGSLLERVNKNEIRLPEIQRGYVWKAGQVAGLIDSLYRKYPSGSLLLWETSEVVTERDASIEGPNELPIARPQYLLDGQQRLTSLFRVWSGDDRARVVFNVEEERFQVESAATKRDKRWVHVHDLIRDKVSAFALAQELSEKDLALGPDEIFARLERVRKIVDYPYYIEILEDLPYPEVTQIFVRVNSKGRSLKKVDLALATLSARWPGVIQKLETEADVWAAENFPHLDVGLLARCLAATSTDTSTLDGFTTVSPDDLESGWQRVKRGLQHIVPLLKNNAHITSSGLLPSLNALVPVVTYLGGRPDEPLDGENANALVYWLMGAFLLGRYNQSVDTVIAQDVAAVRSSDPIKSLFKNLGLLGSRLVVTEEALVGRGANSPYFLLSYLAARDAGATDWFFGVNIAAELEGSLKLEYHHIHPRATIKSDYTKAEINDLANLAFISGKANRRIKSRSPQSYFEELSEEELRSHFVPLDPTLRTVEGYPQFVRERRRLLAAAMTDLLEKYRPEALTGPAPSRDDPSAGEQLALTVYSSYPEGTNGFVLAEARKSSDRFIAAVPLVDLLRFTEDLENGLSASITFGADTSVIEAGSEIVEVDVGPLRVTGTLGEWQEVIERELRDVVPLEGAPSAVTDSSQWEGERSFFPVIDSE